jgi:hypothetical protein
MRSNAYPIALGGMLAAVAVVLMSIGTIIPIATYAVPVLCMVVGQLVLKLCGSRIAWAWYGAVAILSLLLAPDREAAAVFVALGYYPIVKPKLEKKRFPWLWKGLLFNCSILLMYWLLLNVLGVADLTEEFSGMNTAMTALLLLMGNVIFVLLDFMLTRRWKRKTRWGRA